MPTVVSADGTRIGYTVEGSGPPVIQVNGALTWRGFGPAQPLSKLLSPHFTVFSYDRRGRGETGDGETPWSLDREIEDIAALLKVAGGEAFLYGISIGAALALEAAQRLDGVTRLALYEAPFIVDDAHVPIPADFIPNLEAMLKAGNPGEVLKTFLRSAGWPGFLLSMVIFTPTWRKLLPIAHTVPNDMRIIFHNAQGRPLPSEAWNRVTMPTLAMTGSKSPAYYETAMRAVQTVLPDCEFRSLDNQTHMVKPEVMAPELVEFFTRAQRTAGPMA
ncbi:alpha/beta hydrolase [Lentzea sp. NBRC 105346]|uniref:alpha/beta fold hydrolase n=1 Tax=Lentzea sp. NBRC 105346 TaxID=3032205 RepID=UPI0024A23FA1|nr:alpha/beta hydrolase [Lentzea sp. NBRC 105346]GLZ30042.1 alpha/beta hydrolase [Lentzea sp. NBRC 105346]